MWEEGGGKRRQGLAGSPWSVRSPSDHRASSSGTLRCSNQGGIELVPGQSKYSVHSPHCCLDIPGAWEDVSVLGPVSCSCACICYCCLLALVQVLISPDFCPRYGFAHTTNREFVADNKT